MIYMKKLLILLVTLALLAVAALIFGFSSQNSDESGALSQKVTEVVLDTVYPEYQKLSEPRRDSVFHSLHYFVRKAAHFTEYCVFGCLLLVWFRLLWSGLPLSGSAWLAYLVGVLYAIGDELHQSFVSGRGAALKDVVIDSAGVLFGIGLVSLLLVLARRGHARRREKKPRPEEV